MPHFEYPFKNKCALSRSYNACVCNTQQVYTAPEILAHKPYNTQVDVYSFAITLLEIGCRDHRFVVAQFLEKSVGALSVAAVTATGHEGFRPIPKADFVKELPDLWAMVRTHHN